MAPGWSCARALRYVTLGKSLNASYSPLEDNTVTAHCLPRIVVRIQDMGEYVVNQEAVRECHFPPSSPPLQGRGQSRSLSKVDEDYHSGHTGASS